MQRSWIGTPNTRPSSEVRSPPSAKQTPTAMTPRWPTQLGSRSSSRRHSPNTSPATAHSPEPPPPSSPACLEPTSASRPRPPAWLTSNNFFATDTSGEKLPAQIVVADDSSFAWLFFQLPMPGASTITVTLNGVRPRRSGSIRFSSRRIAPSSASHTMTNSLGASLFHMPECCQALN